MFGVSIHHSFPMARDKGFKTGLIVGWGSLSCAE